MAFDTATNVINDAAFELGLITTATSDPYASSVTDANIIRLAKLLKGLGQDLARDFDWSHLRSAGTITTSSGTAGYALPTAGFVKLLADPSMWNTTTDTKVLGPMSLQDWAYFQATGASASPAFIVQNHSVFIHPTPTATEILSYRYQSEYWVRRNWQPSTAYVVGDIVVNDSGKIYTCDTAGTSASSGGPTGTSTNITDGTTRWDYTSAISLLTTGIYTTHDAPTWGGDTVHFDRRLLVLGLKLQFKGDAGFESLKANADFAAAYARAKGADGSAPVLDIAGRRRGFKYIDAWNLPDTGYGS